MDCGKIKLTQLLEGEFGIEKENVRVKENGEMSLTVHPKSLGDKLTHPYITTDFSESQVEMISPVQENIDEAVGFIKTIHEIVDASLEKGEYLWPQSMPPILPEDENLIPIASYGENGRELESYREHLSAIYGKRKQLVSGVHFNYSLSENVMKVLYQSNTNLVEDYDAFKERVYMKIAANYMKNHWFLVALLGASPALHSSYYKYICKCDDIVNYGKTCYAENATSFRVGRCGYRNEKEFILDYTSFNNYKNSINKLIEDKVINFAKENYSALRIKENSQEKITHLEVRHIDLDPFEASGLSEINLKMVHLLLIYGLLEDDSHYDVTHQKISHHNQVTAADFGLDGRVRMFDENGNSISLQKYLESFYQKLKRKLSVEDLPDDYASAMKEMKRLVEHSESRLSAKILKEMNNTDDYVNWHMSMAQKHRMSVKGKNYNFHGKMDMELSTQLLMREAVKRGVSIELIDRPENFIRLEKFGHEEYVVQATKTSLDNYSSILMMENKVVTKKVLEKSGIQVPKGDSFFDMEKAKSYFQLIKGSSIVVKPKSTNFGLGISILKSNDSVEDYERAVEIAFEHDDTILVEEFVTGREFRIFVIEDEVVGILHRVPANVKGDGLHTIAELVDLKNQDPLRGKGYKTPLEKIAKGEAEAMFLKSQGLDFDSIPEEGQVVYLRENSNISTGGDSIDFTDDIHQSYKDIAVKAMKALNVKITGLDMMIDNIAEPATSDNYSIIELNFNPAIHIHCHPFKGKNRKLNEKIMNALGY
ncbi:glutathione biosynthesis bifunctional protein GshAB [Aureibacter tunicatorum]|nr:glutathione biosynthesis bifunctional protein GshAB [Aureibacter tunicatorum]